MNVQFFKRNRERAKAAIHNDPLIVAAFQSMQQTNDASAPFVQEANFWWLTGIEEPGWFFIMAPSYPEGCLVAPMIDSVHQAFDGSLSWDDARNISGIEEIISIDDFEKLLEQLAQQSKKVMTIGKDPHAKQYDFALNPAPTKLVSKLKKYFKEVAGCRLELARLRAIKQPEEIQAMKKAINLTVETFEAIKPTLQSLQYEYEVEAEFTHYFRSHGASGHAYSPIVAAGKNACTLHYGQNNEPLQKNELILLDIGAKVEGYSADITRTYTVGESTSRQQAVHRAVETAHHKIIALLKPGLAVAAYHEQVDVIMKAALIELNLLKTPADYRRYFPHAISHGLGIDVHDALGRPTEFLEGMVLTVEPGIYIPEEGIGVRIEDDILITKTGHENLSAALPTSL